MVFGVWCLVFHLCRGSELRRWPGKTEDSIDGAARTIIPRSWRNAALMLGASVRGSRGSHTPQSARDEDLLGNLVRLPAHSFVRRANTLLVTLPRKSLRRQGKSLTRISVLPFGCEPIYPRLPPLAIVLHWFHGQRPRRVQQGLCRDQEAMTCPISKRFLGHFFVNPPTSRLVSPPCQVNPAGRGFARCYGMHRSCWAELVVDHRECGSQH